MFLKITLYFENCKWLLNCKFLKSSLNLKMKENFNLQDVVGSCNPALWVADPSRYLVQDERSFVALTE